MGQIYGGDFEKICGLLRKCKLPQLKKYNLTNQNNFGSKKRFNEKLYYTKYVK